MAIDTSGSAKSMEGKFFKAASQEMMDRPQNSKITLFRFDSSPAEVYDETPPESLEKATRIVRESLNHTSTTNGTNMCKLLTEMNKRILKTESKVDILIFTDCGVENMTEAEIQDSKKTVKKWAADHKLASIKLEGVKDGQREALRKIFDLPDDLLTIDDLG